ncbi:MAG: phospholipid carrier-dependent glycosyltransferase, partial [Trueperella pyogenes]|nr:phospholipid carrier-dependent glycosyltransferase [Trueperella pyogenes]
MDDKTLSDSDIPEDPALGPDQASPAACSEPLPEAEKGEASASAEVVDKASAEGEELMASSVEEKPGSTSDEDENIARAEGEELDLTPESEEADATSEGTGRKWKPVPIPKWARFPMSAQAGWIATLVTTLLAALIRLPGLGTIKTLVFDETYYVKDAYSLMTLGYEGSWAKDNDPMFISGDYSGLSTNGGYVVHPSVGKWLISLGMRVFGATNPVGWRISAAIAGIILVFLTARIAQHLFRSPAITGLAGFFMATDGIAIVLSRTGLLDIFLAMFAAAAFLAVLKDQEISHPRLVEKLSQWKPDPDNPSRIGPHAGARWWLLV